MSVLQGEVIVSGWLLAPELRAAVLGETASAASAGGAAAQGEAMSLQGYTLRGDLTLSLKAETGATTPALRLTGLTQEAFARLSYFAGQGEEVVREGAAIRVLTGGGLPVSDSDEAWVFDPAWRAHGDLMLEAAARHMAGLGDLDQGAALARWPMVLVRAASTLRARAMPAPATLRRQSGHADVEVHSLSHGYAKFFAVEDYVLSHRKFNGGVSDPLSRAAFVSGDAVVILPYDPAQDTVLLVEQFRTGLLARGDRNPWSLEGVAGRIDAGETPEAAGRREGEEEAGVAFHALLQGPSYYPSPGAKAEFLYNYVGLCDLSQRPTGGGGLEEEGEDIRAHIIPFPQLMALIDSGEINNGPLVVLAYWLARERDKIRAK